MGKSTIGLTVICRGQVTRPPRARDYIPQSGRIALYTPTIFSFASSKTLPPAPEVLHSFYQEECASLLFPWVEEGQL